MTNIDELLINAQLEERTSVSLPWDNKDQHNDDKHDAESCGEIKGIKPETVKYKDDIIEDINNKNDMIKESYGNTKKGYDSKGCHTESDLTWQSDSRRTFPVLKDDKLSVYMPKHPVSAYEQPVAVKVFNAKEFDRTTILADNKCTVREVYGPITPHTSTKRTTTSVKISRNMIQEAKLGYKVHTMSHMNKSIAKGKPSESRMTLHINDHSVDHYPACHTTGLTYQTKNKVSDSKTAYRNNKYDAFADTSAIPSVHKTDYVTKRNDIDELNSLLDETADVMNPEYSKPGVRKGVCSRKYEVSRKEETKYHMNGDLTNNEKNLTNVNKNEHGRFNTGYNRRTAITGLELKAAGSKQDDEQSMEFSESSSIASDRVENIDATKEFKENIDELLKFQCQMMDIKQPKLMSKRKRYQKSITDTSGQEGKQNENDTFSSIDYAKIDELNKKSEALFWKKVRDGKKRKDKKSNIIYINPEPNRRRVRMKNNKVDKSEPLSVVINDAIERSTDSVEMDETKSDNI